MSHPPPAIVFAGKMAAATRPAANATVASAVARIIAGIAATRRTAPRPGTRIGEDPPRPCVSYPVTRMKIAPGTATSVPGPGLATYHVSASPVSPRTGPRGSVPDGRQARHPLTCRYRARPGSLPALLLPRTACPGTVGHPPTARAHRSSDCGSSTGRRARPSHLTDSRVCWLGHDRSGADPGEDPARTDASWRPPTPEGS